MKAKQVFIFIFLFVIILSTILIRPLGDLDEIWNYNFARNILDGRLPYKDFNMLQMPLLPFICSLFLKVFGNELIVMRFLAAILFLLIIFVINKILKFLKFNNSCILLISSFLIILMRQYFCIDYNFFVLLLDLIIIYIELSYYYKKQDMFVCTKIDFWLGILAGLAIALKQSTGLMLAFVLLLYKLLLVVNKQQLKAFLRIFLLRFLGIVAICSIMLIYLILSNSINDFIDYTILGVKTFSNKIPYTYLILKADIVVKVLSVVVPVGLVTMFYRTVIHTPKTEEKMFLYIIFSYSVAMFILVYPIADSIHFLIGSIPTIIGILYMAFYKIKDKYKVRNEILLFISLAILCVCLYTNIKGFNEVKSSYNTEINHYKYIPISKELSNRISKVNNFINNCGKEIYILDASAAVYMIPLDRYNKNYDLLLLGNIGSKGEDGQIDNIKSKQDSLFLILKEDFILNWQMPLKVIKYVRENKIKVGEIEIFDIYE